MPEPTVSICCITKACPSDYMQEWIDYHLDIGIDRIYIYDNNDMSLSIQHPKVTIVPFYVQPRPQLSAYYHYLCNYAESSEWTAFIDDDEFITMSEHCTIQELLKDKGTASGLVLNWRVFGTSGYKERQPGGRMSYLTKRIPVHDSFNRHIKTIAKTKEIQSFLDPHSCRYHNNGFAVDTNGKKVEGPFADVPVPYLAWITHYYTGTEQDWKERQRPGPSSGKYRAQEQFERIEKESVDTDVLLQSLKHIVMRPSDKGLKELTQELPDNCIGIEIGSFAGEASRIFASSGKFKKLYCVDPWKNGYDRKDVASKVVAKYEKEFDKVAKQYPCIEKVKLSSDEALTLFTDKVDFVYIDGCHTYEQVKKDIQNYMPKVKTGGIIAGHDYMEEWAGVKKAVDECLTPDAVYKDSSWMKRITP